MAFKFPVLKPKIINCSGLPVHDFKCLTNKEIIGKGTYGAVFTNYDPYSNEDDSEKAQEGKERLEKRNKTKQTRKIEKERQETTV